MKIRFASSTGIPFGQFVVEAENDHDRALLDTFLYPIANGDRDFVFTLHGLGCECDHPAGKSNFNFGWRKKAPDSASGEQT